MGDWKHREQKIEKRIKNKGMYKAFVQDIRNDKDGTKRRKRQEQQAKIKAQESSIEDADLEE